MKKNQNRMGRGIGDIAAERGLDYLLPPGEPGPESTSTNAGQPLLVAPSLIDLNPNQPRRNFDEKEMASIAQSVKSRGVVKPLHVIAKADGRYELIDGERRLRAARLLNLDKVPSSSRKNLKTRPRAFSCPWSITCAGRI
jgi:ParB family chromosome partitioning protein